MNTIDEIEALTILSGTPYLGSIKIRLLIECFGSATEVLQTDPRALLDLPGFPEKIVNAWGWWKKNSDWQKNLEIADRYGVEIIPYTSTKYPQRLLKITDHPILLYVKGEIKACNQQSLAVVGTRNASIYGLEMAEKISSELSRHHMTVVSGLARGIDTAAHRGALTSGRTIAVIGSGIANLYPRENEQLAEKITEHGALISEFPMTTPPDRQNFPQRNRIVSGMTLGSLLIEAPERSGAMITMNKAFSQDKKLFALPGRVDSPNFRGNHALIKTGKAQLVESAQDILAEFETLFPSQPTNNKKETSIPFLESEEKSLLNLLPQEETSIEEMITITKLPINKLNILLMSLVLKKVIKEYPGKIFKKR